MKYGTRKQIFNEDTGKTFSVGDKVTIKTINGGGMGGCVITKITDTGFLYTQGTGREKLIHYANIEKIY